MKRSGLDGAGTLQVGEGTEDAGNATGVGAVEGSAVFDCAGMLDATLDHAGDVLDWGCTVSAV